MRFHSNTRTAIVDTEHPCTDRFCTRQHFTATAAKLTNIGLCPTCGGLGFDEATAEALRLRNPW